jgi:hypothetical protein
MPAQGSNVDLALHTLGWKAFQDLCAQVCEVAFDTKVSVYREAQDGGQDAVFQTLKKDGKKTVVEATVQCKFSGNANKRLSAGDIGPELATVRELVSAGRAQIYYFLTSQGVDAPVAAGIRDKLMEIGVREPHVMGREWLTAQIRLSARLRALVPRVYGLGDLSTILDERCASQTQALLGHLQPSLRVYVPTAYHRTAVRVLAEHKIVLLLGAPATGKSMLAAILATSAINGEDHQCLKCDGPIELAKRWNPNEKNRLYWIDDAFGPNQLRSDFVDCWIANMPKVKAAIELGNRFILTSRSHIWQGAKPKLGTRNLQVLADEKAIVDLATLSPEEREQIVYNHLKAGNQTAAWKRSIKSHLLSLSGNALLLPEIARRLGDSSFTKALNNFPDDLMRFVAEPEEFLIQTIEELDVPHQAAMTLIFLSQGNLPAHEISSDSSNLVAEKYGVTVRDIAVALAQLKGSFISLRKEASTESWGFIHPTFTDAISSMLSARPDLVELYVRGAKLETLLSEAVCDGAEPIRNAIVIPSSATEHIVRRLVASPDTHELNRALLHFLTTRAPDAVVLAVLDADLTVVLREVTRIWNIGIGSSPRIRFLARVHKLHRLAEEQRYEIADELDRAARSSLDVSFMNDDDTLALFQPNQLLQLGVHLVAALENAIPDRVSEIAEEADPDYDVRDQFDQVQSFVTKLQEVFSHDDSVQGKLHVLNKDIEDAIATVSARSKPDEDDNFWSNISPPKVATAPTGRSIFSDIEE